MTGARVRAALAGRGALPPVDLARDSNGVVEELVGVLRGVSPSSSLLWWVRAELAAQGTADEMLNGLTSPSSTTRVRSARLVGALRVEEAVPALGRLLAHERAEVRAAAARALGLIRGARSADALVRSLYWRRGATRRVVLELARAAPDHYLESSLLMPEFSEVRLHLALAAGLRGSRLAVPLLLLLHDAGGRGERVAACRALGWIGDASAGPLLISALTDPTWQVRVAALKALARLVYPGSLECVEPLLQDRSWEVRRAAEITLARLRRLLPADRDARAVAALEATP